MHYIGKIDKNKIGIIGEKIITDDVIITDERKKHIEEHHPDLLKQSFDNIKKVLENPDYIFQDRKNLDTILLVKTINEDNKIYRIVLKLNTNSSMKNKSNSIISFWTINKKKLNQYIRNEKIIFESMDNL
jgi:hypothetical protein